MDDFKTPVSVLQEYLVSLKQCPSYELLHNGVGTHNPLFIYRVHVNNLYEDGKGKSKREAKHNAAENMLKKLNVDETNSSVPKKQYDKYDEMDPGENYVGMLKEYCLMNPYPEPTYQVEEESGQPHCKVFKMVCFVSQLQEYGISSTKRGAKQIGAFKMLKRLKKLSLNSPDSANDDDDDNDMLTSKKIINDRNLLNKSYTLVPKLILTKEEIFKRYSSHFKGNNMAVAKKNRAVLYKDHHKAFMTLNETSQTLDDLIKNNFPTSMENSMELIKSIATELGAKLTITKIPCKNVDKSFISLCLSGGTEWPQIAGFGQCQDSAAFNLLNTFSILCYPL